MIILDYRDKRPLYEQVTEKLEHLIICGALEANAKLPSVRALAMDLSVNPNTIQRAYRQLEMEGWIATVPGKGCFVCAIPTGDPKQELRLLKQFDEAAGKLLLLGYTAKELQKRLEENHA